MERECLDLLLRGAQPVVWCPARGLPNPRRLPGPARQALAEGRLLMLSPFSGQKRRMTADLAATRNDLVARLACRLLFLYAPSGSKTEGLCKKSVTAGRSVLALAEHCTNLAGLGVRLIDLADARHLRRAGSPEHEE